MPNGNLLRTLQLIRASKRLTRREIAQKLDLSFSMASKLCVKLIEDGLVQEAGRLEVDNGRPSDFLAINPQAGYAIGLDISGTHQKAVISDLRGEVVADLSDQQHIPADRDLILEGLGKMIESVLGRSGLQLTRMLGIGVSLWASVDPATGVISSWTETPTLSATLKDFAIRDALCSQWNLPYIIVDDIVRNLGIAEVQYGHNQVADEDFLFVLADTGIGLAIMLGGSPYVGPFHIAGEIGHIPMEGLTKPCSCGNVGCLETVTSTIAIMNQIHQRLDETNVRSSLRNYENELTIMDVIEATESGDKLAYQTVTEAGEFMGTGLATVVNLLGPRLIIVGGMLSKSSVYLDAAKRNLRLKALSRISTGVRVEATQLDDLAGARGAAERVINELFYSGRMNILTLRGASVKG
jgi:predicted NBD/HSP70 family sugar kinase